MIRRLWGRLRRNWGRGEGVKLWWTVRREEGATLLARGSFLADPETHDEHFVESGFFAAYKWMIESMRRRGIVGADSMRYPCWAWRRACEVTKRGAPDLRYGGHFNHGTPAMCIELEVAAERVLLSDFDLWDSCVLHNIPVSSSEEEELRHMEWDPPEAEKLASWESIFDVDGPAHWFWAGRPRVIQATLAEIRMADVVSVREFVAR